MITHCPNCGAEVPKGAHFCPNCGQPISEEGQPELPQQQRKPHPSSVQQTRALPTPDAPPGSDGARGGLYKVGGWAAMLAGILLVVFLVPSILLAMRPPDLGLGQNPLLRRYRLLRLYLFLLSHTAFAGGVACTTG